MMSQRTLGLFAFLMPLVGCAASMTSDAALDCSARLESCLVGATWAECGEGPEDEPRFACSGNRCLWFARGCVPEGFEASACPAANLCCEPISIEERGYPFADFEIGSSSAAAVATFVHGWGVTPWDRERERHLAVEVAPLAPTELTIACTPPERADSRGPCTEAPRLSSRWGGEGVVTLTLGPANVAILATELHVEITRDQHGALRARACRAQTTDQALPYCVGPGPICAERGSLVLERMPDSAADLGELRFSLEASFADGITIHAGNGAVLCADHSAPAIEGCDRGVTWARCDGASATAEPRLACRPGDGRCFWFEGGCVAEGFEPSRCPADQVCCVPSWSRSPGLPVWPELP